jgi:16S rRNA (uracil1498-N3)-methyltransferase
MRLNRFIGDFDFSQKEIHINDFAIIKQIKSVLRLAEGDNIILLNGKGKEIEVKINKITKESIDTIFVKEHTGKELKRKVHLFLAILKKENFDLAIQKAVESGVSEITPILTERTVKTGLNTERLNKIIREACEQSGRNTIPALNEIQKYPDALEIAKNAEEKIVFHLTDQKYTPQKEATNINIFIGPEGGFSEKEITLAKEKDYTISSLGDLTLRGETAAIIATYRSVNGI